MLQVELSHFTFDEDSDRFTVNTIPYTALSYTWGHEKPTFEILINDLTFTVRQNLYDFLDAAWTLKEAETWFWIDQLCINQNDIAERNYVVRQMTSIYSKAERVNIWLGERNEHTDTAFRVLARFNELEKQAVQQPDTSLDDIESHADEYEAIFDEDDSFAPAVAHLFSRPFWARLWVVQEVALAKTLRLQCGTARLEPAAVGYRSLPDNAVFLATLLHSMDSCVDVQTEDICVAAAFRLYNAGHRFMCTDLWLTLYWFHGSCSDPRDHVFALMGIVIPEQRIPIDYSMPTIEVFRLAIAMAFTWCDLTLSEFGEADSDVVRHLLVTMNLWEDITPEELEDLISTSHGASDSRNCFGSSELEPEFLRMLAWPCVHCPNCNGLKTKWPARRKQVVGCDTDHWENPEKMYECFCHLDGPRLTLAREEVGRQ